ncbi:hypothetical protein H0H93_010690 [Arthromyces matolae]|nr:hypothetical protein H0H93_010690 [Arthromyces matolae]
MSLVDNETFLSRLAALFTDKKAKGTIWLTHKRLERDGEDAIINDASTSDEGHEYPCLVRVKEDKKTKFSTKVRIDTTLSVKLLNSLTLFMIQADPGQLEKFYAAYGSLLKAAMTTLRKRDKKREKLRLEQSALRKKKMTEPVALDGPKRGNGRRKRQRQVKAAIKQQESQRKFKEREEAKERKEQLLQ